MDFTTGIVVWIGAVALVAVFTQGLTGFGLAVICTPLLALWVPMKTTVPVAAIWGGAVTVPIIWALRRHILWKPVLVLTLSAAPGVWLGARLLKTVPDAWITGTLGVILLSVAVFQLSNGRVPAALRGRLTGIFCGFLAGALGASTSAPGPAVIAYTSLQDWDVRVTKAVMNVFFLLQSLIVVSVFGATGLLTSEVKAVSIWASPFVAGGLAAGMLLSHGLRNRMELLRRIIYSAVLLLGISMLAKAFWP